MGRRRDSHRRHRELTDRQELDLLGWVGDEFESEEARQAAWAEHGPRLLEDRGGLPGTRPAAYWDYTPGAPQREDFISVVIGPFGEEEERVDSDALYEAELRYLAERGELRDDELQKLVDDVAEKVTWTPEAQDRAQRHLEAALDGMAARQHDQAA